MSRFIEYRKAMEQAIKACLATAAEHRDTFELTEVPSSIITQAVEQHIAPLGGKENTQNVAIVPGKPDWRKNATEVVFRRTLLSIANEEEVEERYRKTMDCLDIVLHCTAQGVDLLDTVIPLTLIEELLDVNTTTGCEKIFTFVEKRKSLITEDMVPGRGKGLVLLRMCNELLRRLSKEINTVFCGRILMFLANTFPLGERSGVNLRGDFNNEVLAFDKPEDVEGDSSLTDEQKSFYNTFWATRSFFTNPPSVFNDTNFEKLQHNTSEIIKRFQIIAEREAEVLGARKSELVGLKRKSTDVSMESEPLLAAELLEEINKNFQFPRLLSSRKLLDLEMDDIRFRRNVIVQYLILLQYLNGFSEAEKERTANILSARGTTKQSLIQPNATLTEDQVTWINETKETLITLLRATKPHGNLYTDIVLIMLANERHWIIWKASGCPPFEKPAITIADIKKSLIKKKPKLSIVRRESRHPRGNFAASTFVKNEVIPLAQFMNNRSHLPSPTDIISHALDELDDSLDPPKVRFDIAGGALLQSTRLLYATHPPLVRQVYAAKKESYKEMRERAKEDDEPSTPTSTETKSAQPTSFTFKVGDTITEDHVQAEAETLRKAQKLFIDETTITPMEVETATAE